MDIFYEQKIKKRIAVAVAVLGCVLMIGFPDIALLSARKGILLWAGNVLPALLPFFICVSFVTSLGIAKDLPRGIFVFVMSVLAGYPMGARLVGSMAQRGEIDAWEARRLIAFGTTAGPTFLLGSVGIGMLGSHSAGIVLALSHYGGALLSGAVLMILSAQHMHRKRSYGISFVKSTRRNEKKGSLDRKENDSESLFAVFTSSILSALRSLGIVLAYLVLFMFITDFIQDSGLLDFIPMPEGRALLKGIFEMTVGCSALSQTAILPARKTVFAAFLVSFGGLSVIGQSMSMLGDCGVTLRYFLLLKLCHGALAAGIAGIILTFL